MNKVSSSSKINSTKNSSSFSAHTSKASERQITSLDIGSTAVKIVIANVNSEQKIEVVGIGVAPNSGLKQGVVVNIESTTECIRKAKEEAELMSGFKSSAVWVSVSGSHVKSFDSTGMVAVKNKEVTQADIDRVIEAAKAVQVPTERIVLHVIAREFKLDHQDGIMDPIGMSGVRLEANVHIVTASQAAVSNLTKCIEKAGLVVAGLVLDQVAVSKSVISSDEKNLGVCVLDIGGGASKLVYMLNGSVAHTAVIPIGGQHFTQDVAVGLRTPQVNAEILKKNHGCALASLVMEDELVDVEGVGGRKPRSVAKKELATILEARTEECLSMVSNHIRMSGMQPLLGSGVVITGGASQLDGLIEMGEFIFEIPVRRGLPMSVQGLQDIVKGAEFSTSIGLLQYGYEKNRDQYVQESESIVTTVISESMGDFSNKVKKFFADLF